MHGDEDKVVPHSHGVKLAKVFGVSIESCKGGGHSGIFETHTKQYMDALAKFFRARLAKLASTKAAAANA